MKDIFKKLRDRQRERLFPGRRRPNVQYRPTQRAYVCEQELKMNIGVITTGERHAYPQMRSRSSRLASSPSRFAPASAFASSFAYM